ncbi:hypothetical protein JOF53_007520 [Crossiella equi]|uniref:DUF2975 domain-containing protein n=1 Tax=Crossiella equi TaxID=130796 RepID=A0ABS5AQ10_9PSEU|nr:DUF2975 domain-containing protein [Crossiella equi]MBP2478648.1 hypothetical protein [Crossiella equi]
MNRTAVLILRAFVAFALLVSVFGQFVVVPGAVREELDLYPEFADRLLPYTVVGVAGVACVQVALVAVWFLLGLVHEDAMFTARAFRWVDLVIGATTAATALSGGFLVHMLTSIQPGPVANLFGITALAFGGFALALVLVVLRGLLRKATSLEDELAVVV